MTKALAAFAVFLPIILAAVHTTLTGEMLLTFDWEAVQ